MPGRLSSTSRSAALNAAPAAGCWPMPDRPGPAPRCSASRTISTKRCRSTAFSSSTAAESSRTAHPRFWRNVRGPATGLSSRRNPTWKRDSGATPNGGAGGWLPVPPKPDVPSFNPPSIPELRTAMSWADHAWTRADLPAGLAALARRAGIVSAQDALRMPSNTEFDLTAARSGNLDRDDHDLWLGHRADELGIRLEAVSARYPKLGEMLLNAAPAILRIDCDGREGFILLTGSRGASLRVLDTDLKERRISCTEVIETMSAGFAAAIPTDVDACVREAGIHPRRRARARDG